jgi:NAD(P)-dependent dehydrogenase (short-subunit alcohol dehydrogenase family)
MQKRVLITGVSTGIGRDFALRLVKEGFEVWGTVRNQADFMAIEKEGVRGVMMDVSKPESIAAAVSTLPSEFDVLINNAGQLIVGRPAESLKWEDWQRIFNVNMFGLAEVTRLMLPRLRPRIGTIVNLSSIAGLVAGQGNSIYSSSKFAVESYSDCLRRELRPFGMKVIIIEPGPIETAIWKKSETTTEKKVQSLDSATYQLYLPHLVKQEKVLNQVLMSMVKPSVVTDTLMRALRAKKPKLRYPVGKGIKVLVWLSKIIPDRLIDRVM